MAKQEIKTDAASEQGAAESATRGQNEETGVKLVTVVYSAHGDIYRVAQHEAAKKVWLSVAKFSSALPEPAVPRTSEILTRLADSPARSGAQRASTSPYLGAIQCGAGWRKAYSLDWSVVQPGATVTLPENDELVVDYAQAELKTDRAESAE